MFQGVVIRRQGAGVRETFTVRKVSFGVGVERTFPVHTPVIDKIEVVTRGDVRRAKLYYLRELRGKAAKIKESRDSRPPPADRGPRWSAHRSRYDGVADRPPSRRRHRAPDRSRGALRASVVLLGGRPCTDARWCGRFVVAPFSIPSGSMEQTLQVGDRMPGRPAVSYRFADVEPRRCRRLRRPTLGTGTARGKVGVRGLAGRTRRLRRHRRRETDYVKRVIGVGGRPGGLLRRPGPARRSTAARCDESSYL